MTLVAAAEMGRYGVTVNAIAPSARTRMTETVFADMMSTQDNDFDSMAPENISPLVVWLGSVESRDVTGKMFEVEGGIIRVAEGWAHGPEVDKGARWDPAELGPVVNGSAGEGAPAGSGLRRLTDALHLRRRPCSSALVGRIRRGVRDLLDRLAGLLEGRGYLVADILYGRGHAIVVLRDRVGNPAARRHLVSRGEIRCTVRLSGERGRRRTALCGRTQSLHRIAEIAGGIGGEFHRRLRHVFDALDACFCVGASG